MSQIYKDKFKFHKKSVNLKPRFYGRFSGAFLLKCTCFCVILGEKVGQSPAKIYDISEMA